jgi:hypothetical protein
VRLVDVLADLLDRAVADRAVEAPAPVDVAIAGDVRVLQLDDLDAAVGSDLQRVAEVDLDVGDVRVVAAVGSFDVDAPVEVQRGERAVDVKGAVLE